MSFEDPLCLWPEGTKSYALAESFALGELPLQPSLLLVSDGSIRAMQNFIATNLRMSFLETSVLIYPKVQISRTAREKLLADFAGVDVRLIPQPKDEKSAKQRLLAAAACLASNENTAHEYSLFTFSDQYGAHNMPLHQAVAETSANNAAAKHHIALVDNG